MGKISGFNFSLIPELSSVLNENLIATVELTMDDRVAIESGQLTRSIVFPAGTKTAEEKFAFLARYGNSGDSFGLADSIHRRSLAMLR